jgi:hypothetical protein
MASYMPQRAAPAKAVMPWGLLAGERRLECCQIKRAGPPGDGEVDAGTGRNQYAQHEQPQQQVDGCVEHRRTDLHETEQHATHDEAGSNDARQRLAHARVEGEVAPVAQGNGQQSALIQPAAEVASATPT